MIEKQTVCLRILGENRANEVKFGRMFSNDRFTETEITETIVAKAYNVVEDRHVLCIQDTTEINHQAHRNRVSGLGPVGNGKDIGFFLHPTLVLDADEKTCLGFSSIKTWIRPESDQNSKKPQSLPIEEKESFRWIESAENSKKSMEKAKMITIIADRESDIYEEWYRIPDEKTHLITRASRNRYLTNGKKIFEHVNALDVSGSYEFDVMARPGKRSKHRAKLEIRFSKIELKKPLKCTDKNAPNAFELFVVDVKEMPETVIQGEEPIHWCLLTTHCVENIDQALKIVDWYCERWNVEQLFRTLKKQGLNVESSQVETGNALIKLCIIATYVALITMQLTMAREGKDQIISVVFNQKEQDFLLKILPTLEGKTQKQKNPHHHSQLSFAAWVIARLGGWKGYKSESPPGPITMLRGFQKFQTLLEGYELADLCA